MATHSGVLAWRIPGTEAPGRLPSIGSHRIRHDWSDLAAAAAASIFLELFLRSSSVACWTPSNLGSSSLSVISFWLFILFMDSQGKNVEVVCHSLLQWTTFFSELSTMTRSSWVALHGIALGFSDLGKELNWGGSWFFCQLCNNHLDSFLIRKRSLVSLLSQCVLVCIIFVQSFYTYKKIYLNFTFFFLWMDSVGTG